MAQSHKDWELPNSRIWLAEIDIDRGPDFPISNVLQQKSCRLKSKTTDYFHLAIFISVTAKMLMRKKSNQNEQTLEELNSAHCHSQAKCQLVQTS